VACIMGTLPRRLVTPLLLAACAACAACAGAPPVPRPPPPPPPSPQALAPPAPPLPPTEAERLDEAARLLADGVRLERAALLLAAVAPGAPRRDLLLGQLAELSGDDAGAAAAYERVLAKGEDGEVRLRRALALERLGRGAEVEAELRSLREAGRREPEAEVRTARTLRPLRPSSR
jgi:hypothetical protein